MDTANENKSLYELSFLVTEESQIEDFKKLLSQHQGVMVSEGPIRKIQLAYKIKKQAGAFFGYFHLEMEKEKMVSLGKDIRLNNSVLRTLIVANPPLPFVGKKQASAPAAARGDGAVLEQKPLPVSNMESLPISNEDLEKKIEEILK